MTESPDVVFEERDGLGLILLNRPKALNALTTDMLRRMDAKLQEWAGRADIAAVVAEGAGERAFSAGGDIRALYEDGQTGGPLRAEFYRVEYRYNRRLFRFAKPHLALIDGVTMGGGVGASVPGSHRVATERTVVAMPETGIGLFPDVGGSHLLPRCPGETGLYLALTGARLGAADCLYLGIATHFVPAARLDALVDATMDALAAASDRSRRGIDAVLAEFATDPGPPPMAEHRPAIDRCFAADSVEAILANLAGEGSAWAAQTAATLHTKSPTSLKIALRQLRAGPGLTFEDCMVMEYRLSQRCMQGHDFFEGVRAVVIDKDNAPRWRPATLEEVSTAEIEAYFAPLERDLVFT